MKDLKQIVQDTQQQVKSNPQSMNNSVQGTTPTPVPRVQSTPQRQSQMESVPRVDPTVRDENVRITRSMSSNNNMNNIINNIKPSRPVVRTITNSNNNMGNRTVTPTATNNNTVQLSRMRKIKRLARQALMNNTVNNDGPASRTRSKVDQQIKLAAPPAANTAVLNLLLHHDTLNQQRIADYDQNKEQHH